MPETTATEQATKPASLSEQYQSLLKGMSALENIPNYRPDLKAQEAQVLTQKAIALTGQLIVSVEEVDQRLAHIDTMAEKLATWLEGKEGWNHEES